jgi:hypothetical protein
MQHFERNERGNEKPRSRDTSTLNNSKLLPVAGYLAPGKQLNPNCPIMLEATAGRVSLQKSITRYFSNLDLSSAGGQSREVL